MGEVNEMLEMPSYTQLPGVADWVKGVSNVRGRLLPLSDLAAFLGGELSTTRHQQRVLVIEVDEIYCGLVVDAVYGMQHFPVETYSNTVAPQHLVEGITPFMQGVFSNDEGQEWPVFSPWAVIRDERFTKAAAVIMS
jgi:twitching motility protein PilI